MSDRYTLYDKPCPYCMEEIDEVFFNEEWANTACCPHCGKKFDIVMSIDFEKRYDE